MTTFDKTKINPSSFTADMTVVVTGSTTLSQKVYDATYLPLVKKAIEAGAKIHVGSAPGVDQMTRNALLAAQYENFEVLVPMKHAATEKPVDINEDKICIVAGGYRSRDLHMCKGADAVICFLSQYGGGGSGACANMLLVATGLDGIAITELVRHASFDWNRILGSCVQEKESEALFEAEVE